MSPGERQHVGGPVGGTPLPIANSVGSEASPRTGDGWEWHECAEAGGDGARFFVGLCLH